MEKEVFRDMYNKGISSCAEVTRYRAQVLEEGVATLGLVGSTPESKEYLIRMDTEVKTLRSLSESFEKLKI